MTTRPKRMQRKRSKGWRKPDGSVCVTRPGPFGNPYKTADEFREALRFALLVRDHNRESTGRYIAMAPREQHMMRIADRIDELRGKDLLCFCKPGASCHGDVLIEMANQDFSPIPSPRVLTLRLKGHWWHQIARGEKLEELRLQNDHWRRRLIGREYDEVHLWWGYPPKSDVSKLLRRRWCGVDSRTVTHTEFGDRPVEVFAIDVSQPVDRQS